MLPTINMQKTGENIRYLRKKSGLTVRKVQKTFGFTTAQAIYKWENGRSIPSVDNLVALSDLFNVSIEDILIVERNI